MKQYLTVPLEIKALSEREFEGHGSIFGNVDLGGDVVLPGAFKKSLARHKKAGTLPQMFWMHQPDKVPGKWTVMEEDERGLYDKGELAPTSLGSEMHTLLQMKAVRGQSIGYVPMDWDYDKDGRRLLVEIDLWEVSLVSLAMNPLAMVESMKAARLSAAGEYVPTVREFERYLRDAGCSKTISRKLIAKIFDDEDSGETPETNPGGMPDIDGEAQRAAKALADRLELMTLKAACSRLIKT